jgi:hypothetical protein
MTAGPDGHVPAHAADPDHSPDGAAVRFTQRVGEEWLDWAVLEVDAAAVPGALGPRCLLFTRPHCIRRVWDYPPDWRTLDDAGLAALSWHR